MSVRQMLLNLFQSAPRPASCPRPPPRSEGDLSLLALSQELLRGLGHPALANRVQIEWSTRLKTTAGNAHRQTARIRLNPRLRPFGAAEVDRTLRHELAHLLAWERAGGKRIAAHGPEWRAACAALGIAGEKCCHALPLAERARQKKRFLYRCPACAAAIPRVRPFRRRTACLPCCRQFNQGRYDDRFRLVKIRLEP